MGFSRTFYFKNLESYEINKISKSSSLTTGIKTGCMYIRKNWEGTHDCNQLTATGKLTSLVFLQPTNTTNTKKLPITNHFTLTSSTSNRAALSILLNFTECVATKKSSKLLYNQLNEKKKLECLQSELSRVCRENIRCLRAMSEASGVSRRRSDKYAKQIRGEYSIYICKENQASFRLDAGPNHLLLYFLLALFSIFSSLDVLWKEAFFSFFALFFSSSRFFRIGCNDV